MLCKNFALKIAIIIVILHFYCLCLFLTKGKGSVVKEHFLGVECEVVQYMR